MAKNILSVVENLTVELLDNNVGVCTSKAETIHEEFTISVFEKLVDYIRSCSWSDNDTTKFVARNFTVAQSDLPFLWASMFPDRPLKADSTFRVQYQNINRYLATVFPSNLYDIFLNDEREALESINLTLDSLKLNDRRIEDELGSQLCFTLSSLPLTGKKFTMEECKYELSLMNKLSIENNIRELSNCDEAKLAYVYWVLTRPSVVNGNINKTRLDFIHGMLSSNSPIKTSECKEDGITIDAELYGVLRYLYDVIETKDTKDIIELCKTYLAKYIQHKDNKNYFLLDRVKTLLEAGNEVLSVKSLLSNTVGVTTNTANSSSTDSTDLLSLVKNSINCDSDISDILGAIKDVCSEKGISYDLFNGGGMKFIKQYIEGVEPDADTFANTDVINFIHLHCTKNGIERGLQQFSKKDVAYVVQEIENGNKDYIDSIKRGINIDSMNSIGDYTMCTEAKHEIERLIADTEPSDVTNGEAYSLVKDYTLDGMKARISSVPVEDLAKVYDDMLSSDECL